MGDRKRLARGAALALAAGFMLAAAPAEAKIYIPCTGDRLVTIKEIPKDKQPAGQTVHLGYRFSGCFGEGEWVGTTDESNRYYKLTPNQLREVVARAGLKQLPPTPSRLQHPIDALMIELIMAGVLILVFGWEFIRKRREKSTSA